MEQLLLRTSNCAQHGQCTIWFAQLFIALPGECFIFRLFLSRRPGTQLSLIEVNNRFAYHNFTRKKCKFYADFLPFLNLEN